LKNPKAMSQKVGLGNARNDSRAHQLRSMGALLGIEV
jgi:hypothetical protein